MTTHATRKLRHATVAALLLGSVLAPRDVLAQLAGRKDEPPADAPPKPKLEPPTLTKFVEAVYPPDALKAGLKADVILRLDIDETGHVVDARVPNPVGNGFDEAAIAAAKQFEWDPAKRDGKPIAVKNVPYKYSFTFADKPPVEPGTEPGAVDKPPPPPAPKTILQGRVAVEGGSIPVSGARVVIVSATGVTEEMTTAADGTWSVRDLPPGKYKVTVTAGGYNQTTAEEEVSDGQATEVTYRLTVKSDDGVAEVTVVGEKPPREVTKRTIENRELSRIPGTNGDALRALQNLPGVARPPGLAGLLIVRGSAPNDTQVFVDGTLVPLVYHFGGLSSVIPTEEIDKLDFYPGNFSAQYGRVMGGIVDVGVRGSKGDGKYHGLAQADFIDARLMLEGPVPLINGWTFMVAGRRSYVDIWLKPVLTAANAGVTTAPVYYDYQIFAETKPTSKSSFRIGFFGSDDKLEFVIKSPLAADPTVGGDLGFHTGFWRAQALYKNQLTNDLSMKTVLAYGLDSINFNLGSLLFNLDSHPLSNRLEFSYNLGHGFTANVGQDILFTTYNIDVRAPQPPRPGEPDPGPFAALPPRELTQSSSLYTPAVYVELEGQITDRLRVVPGFRVDYNKATQSWDTAWRANARYALINEYPKTTLKGGAGVFNQPPQPQESSTVFGSPLIHSNRAYHYSVGFEQDLAKQVDISVEGFYKDLTNLVSRVPGPDGNYEYSNQGKGYVVGSEVLLRYRPDDRFFGWLAYTLSRSVRQDSEHSAQYLFQYDQTHILTVLGSYRLGRGWEFGARFRLVSGNLDTPCNGGVFNSAAGAYACITGTTFSERVPMFHQLDLRLDKHWDYDSWRLSVYLDLQNVYNHQNPESLDYNFNYTQGTYSTGLPIIPSLGIRGEF